MTTGQNTNRTAGTIDIVGGGVSGVLTAYHLRRQNVQARVVVIEPRKR
jgi:glycine/D-amino acid oxidase-like deaminating enzyme